MSFVTPIFFLLLEINKLCAFLFLSRFQENHLQRELCIMMLSSSFSRSLDSSHSQSLQMFWPRKQQIYHSQLFLDLSWFASCYPSSSCSLKEDVRLDTYSIWENARQPLAITNCQISLKISFLNSQYLESFFFQYLNMKHGIPSNLDSMSSSKNIFPKRQRKGQWVTTSKKLKQRQRSWLDSCQTTFQKIILTRLLLTQQHL